MGHDGSLAQEGRAPVSITGVRRGPSAESRKRLRYHISNLGSVSAAVRVGGREFTLVDFSSEGMRFAVYSDVHADFALQADDVLESVSVHLNTVCVFTGGVEVRSVSQVAAGHFEYGVQFLDGTLDVQKILVLRNLGRSQAETPAAEKVALKPRHRVKRYGEESLADLPIAVSFRSEFRGKTARLCDVSEFGLGLEVEGKEGDGALLPGALLEGLSVEVGGEIAFSGRARVVYCKPTGQGLGLRLGVFCLDQKVNLEVFWDARKLLEIKADFATFLSQSEVSAEIRPDFKVAVGDFRYFLENMKAYLEAEEGKIRGNLRLEKGLIGFSARVMKERILTLAARIDQTVQQFSPEEDKAHRRYFQAQLFPLTSAAIICKRSVEKPLGYAGDYEMMNIIYEKWWQGNSLWERFINYCIVHFPSAQAVRNRADYLVGKIAKTVEERSGQDEIHIMSLASGPCKEIRNYLESTDRQAFRGDLYFYLLDQDPTALDCAQRKLYELAQFEGNAAVHFILLERGVKHFLKNPDLMARYPKMDLIYSAGLFDYLPDPVAKALTVRLLNTLRPQGELIIGNFAQKSRCSFFMEYACEWFLICRSPEELKAFLPAGQVLHSVSVESEKEEVNLFLNVSL